MTQALPPVLMGVQRGDVNLDVAAPPFDKPSHALEEMLAGRDTFFSWWEFTAVRAAAAEFRLKQQFGARVRLTGTVPIADDEFSSVREGWLVTGIGTVLIVLGILRLALRSDQIILTVLVTPVIGLSITVALGLLMAGTFNVIWIAFCTSVRRRRC